MNIALYSCDPKESVIEITGRLILTTLLALILTLGLTSESQAAISAATIDKLLASDGAANEIFGISVSIAGDTAVIGARLDDDNGNDSGSAYVFVRDGSNNWSQQAKLTANDGAASDQFGISVSIAGDTAVIGAFLDDDNGNDSGSAYLFDLNSLTPNSAPIAQNDSTGPVDNAGFLAIDVLTNDEDSDGSLDVSSVTKVTEPSNGTATVNTTTGLITYTHDGSATTSDSFTYTVLDNEGAVSNVATVTLTINEVVIPNVPPTAQDDTAGSIDNAGSLVIDVLTNDSDNDGSLDVSSVIKETEPDNGTATINTTTGLITYTHDGSATTSDSFTYTVLDNEGAVSNVATVTVTINEVVIPNVPPTAQDDTAGPIDNAGILEINVLTNDSDSDGSLDVSSVIKETEPSNGTATINTTTGLITYTHDGSATTSDSFTYTVLDNEGAVSNVATVTLTINEVVIPNVSPIAQDDTAGPIDNAGTLEINVLTNDEDSDGSLDVSSVTKVTEPDNGTATINTTTGLITYTHDGSATTSDSFTYTVLDNEGTVSNVATVSITINSSSASCGIGIELDGINDLINIPDLVLRGDFTLEGWVKLAPGIDHKDGLLGDGVYTHLNFVSGKPRLNAYGVRITANTAIAADTWSHIAVTRSGSNLTMYVNGMEDATGIYGGSLTIKFLGKGYRGYFKGMMDEIRIWNIERSGTEINDSYNTNVDPNALGLIGYWNFNGTGQMITDVSSSSNHGSLGINEDDGTDDPVRLGLIDPLIEHCDGSNTNEAPLASDDTIGPIETGATINFSVTGNDTDSDGNLDPTSVEIVSEPNDGIASVDASGKITYKNTGTTATTDTLSYTVSDTEGVISNIATVSITISDPATNEIPVAQADTATVQTGDFVLITVLSNDSDSDGSLNTNSLTIVNEPSYGTVDIDGAGEIAYTHDGSATTSDSFTYTIEDDQGAVSNIATVSITINSASASCGKGIELDGINDLINIPDLVLRGDFTLEGWVKLAPGIDHKDGLLGDGVYTHLNFVSGKLRLNAYGARITGNTVIPADTWSHIAVTRSGSNLTMYVNGMEDATGLYAGSLTIKFLGKGHRGFLKGMMDEIRIWNIERSGTEINDSYNTSVDSNAPGLIGYWDFNDVGQIISDTSGSASHGSLGISTTVGADDPVRLDSTAPLTENCDEA